MVGELELKVVDPDPSLVWIPAVILSFARLGAGMSGPTPNIWVI
jgi:hypothetical protein